MESLYQLSSELTAERSTESELCMKFKVILLCCRRNLEKSTFLCIENQNYQYICPLMALSMAGSVLCKPWGCADKGYLARNSQSMRGTLVILWFLSSCHLHSESFIKETFLKLLSSNMERWAVSRGWRITKVVYVGGGNCLLQNQLE